MTDCCLLYFQVAALLTLAHGQVWADGPVDFNQDVRPILASRCYQCHGPDEHSREAGLRLDQQDGALAELNSGARAIVPHQPAASELLRRLLTADEHQRMPPPAAGQRLSRQQITTLQHWIEQGAIWQKHWSFVAPDRPAPARVTNSWWLRNSIDRFVLSRLERERWMPSGEADRSTLIRRLSLDLTGLPPALDEVEAFVADNSPNAYQKVVDRQLASPHFGEKMAQWWLDLARFGDTNGYQDDRYRAIWVYRDYVIDAFNHNKPFDQFTIENLAGDMLANATIEQKILSGFNRMHRFNEEGGSDPNEFRVVYVIDRANTTASVWMGLSFGCGQCHDHKYDPISQREYYSFYAFFNSLKDEVPVSKKLSPPYVHAPSLAQRQRVAEIDAALSELRQKSSTSGIGSAADRSDEHTRRIDALCQERATLVEQFPVALIMEEMQPRRPVFVLTRGDWQQPGERVEANVPAVLPPLSEGAPRN